MQVQIFYFNQKIRGRIEHDIVPTHLGYAEVDVFDAEDIWKLCNWSNYLDKKPDNLHADISNCGHGLCLINPETQERWLSLSHGWLIGDEKTISDYVFKNRYMMVWD